MLVLQLQRQTKSIASQAEFERRVAPALALGHFFSLEVRPKVIAGGRVDPPEGDGAA